VAEPKVDAGSGSRSQGVSFEQAVTTIWSIYHQLRDRRVLEIQSEVIAWESDAVGRVKLLSPRMEAWARDGLTRRAGNCFVF
jgi:hypothetical protein